MKLKQRVMKKVSKPIKSYFKDKKEKSFAELFLENSEYNKAYDNFCKTKEELKKEKN